MPDDTLKKARFELVTAGHHFLVDVLPFREPESSWALSAFVSAVQRSGLPPTDIDGVLLRCLTVLNEHSDQRVPSLVERYLVNQQTLNDCAARFAKCVEDVLRYRGISDGSVQQAVELVARRLADPMLTPQSIARELNVRLSTLCVTFKRQTGRTLRQEIRELRLGRAASLLATTSKTIKEIWCQVGYNHPSNFDHDFKQRFHVSPSRYRSQILRPAALEMREQQPADRTDTGQSDEGHAEKRRILIVDDDECSRTMIGRYLKLEGYAVYDADCGAAGLREVARVRPDAILLDYRLGDMDGLEFLRALRGPARREHPAVALFTADWNIVDHTHEVERLDATIASKLCDLALVGALVSSLLDP